MDTLIDHALHGFTSSTGVMPRKGGRVDLSDEEITRVGLLNTVTGFTGYRQDIIDERAGMAGADVVVEESGAPVLLVVRLKVVGGEITEIETVATRSRAEGLIFNIDGLRMPSKEMNHAPRPGQLMSREDAIDAALGLVTPLSEGCTSLNLLG